MAWRLTPLSSTSWLPPCAQDTSSSSTTSVCIRVRGRAAIEATGAHLAFLPTYSPDLHPIELAFAKIKTALRRAEARSFDRLVPALSTALETITATDAQAFYRAAGYAA